MREAIRETDHPHLTIAAGLKPAQFQCAWESLAPHVLHAEEQVTEVVLLRRAMREGERDVQTQKAMEENAASAKPKPDAVIQNNIIPGRMKRFFAENTLMGQAFVINPDQTVADAAKEAGVEITGYARVAVGEGVEKKEEDFAAEVAKMVKG